MHLIEQFSEGKAGDPGLCEDLYVYNDDLVAVVDGATNITGGLYHNKAPGRIAAETIKESLEELAPDATLQQMLVHINQSMRQAHEAYGLKEEIENDKWKAPSASLIVYSRHHQQIWQIGDCQCMVDDVLYKNEKEIDSITANARSMYLEAELKKGKTIGDLMEKDTGWEYTRPLIQQQYYLQNDPENQYGFEVVNGFPVDETRIKTIDVSPDTKEIVLASDGYPFLKATLQETEAELTALLKEDPLCFRIYKTGKGLIKGNRSFDDRLYVRVGLES